MIKAGFPGSASGKEPAGTKPAVEAGLQEGLQRARLLVPCLVGSLPHCTLEYGRSHRLHLQVGCERLPSSLLSYFWGKPAAVLGVVLRGGLCGPLFQASLCPMTAVQCAAWHQLWTHPEAEPPTKAFPEP